MDLGEPASYLSLSTGTPVFSSDEEELGLVDAIRSAPDLDIFDGIVIAGGSAGRRYVDADLVREIFERGVLLSITAAEAATLPDRAG